MIKYRYKDEYSNDSVVYWFEVDGDLYGRVEGKPGYDYTIREDGSLVAECDSDNHYLPVTDEIRYPWYRPIEDEMDL